MAAKGKVTRPWSDERPKNYYLDCIDRPRPCPWVGCKHNLMLDVNQETGSITLNVGRETAPGGRRGRQVMTHRRLNTISARSSGKGLREQRLLDEGIEKLFTVFEKVLKGDNIQTCVLDCVTNEKSHTLEEVGSMLSVTRERIRQIESRAEKKLREMSERGECEEWTEMQS